MSYALQTISELEPFPPNRKQSLYTPWLCICPCLSEIEVASGAERDYIHVVVARPDTQSISILCIIAYSQSPVMSGLAGSGSNIVER